MTDDHARLDELLRGDAGAFERFRAGLLRHIGIEEKILLPAARRRRAGASWPLAEQIRVEHAALGALLVPTPDAALVDEIATLLAAHNTLEEQDGGLYADIEALAADEAALLLERAQAAVEPPLARHFDGAGTLRTAAAALALAERRRRR